MRLHRVSDALIVVCHGGDDEKGVWRVWPDNGPSIPMRQFAWTLHLLKPSRPLVLICCNRAGHGLGVPNTYYALFIVSSVPDRFNWCRGRTDGKRWIGKFEEFQHNQ